MAETVELTDAVSAKDLLCSHNIWNRDWIKLRNKDFSSPKTSTNTIKIFKLRKMKEQARNTHIRDAYEMCR
jgi:hypothetical protein